MPGARCRSPVTRVPNRKPTNHAACLGVTVRLFRKLYPDLYKLDMGMTELYSPPLPSLVKSQNGPNGWRRVATEPETSHGAPFDELIQPIEGTKREEKTRSRFRMRAETLARRDA